MSRTLQEWRAIADFDKPFDTLVDISKEQIKVALLSSIPVPGWKLTERYSRLKWLDEDVAIQDLRAQGLTDDQIFKTALRTPTEVRAAGGDVNGLVIEPEGDIVAVPSTARAKEIIVSSGEEFDNDI